MFSLREYREPSSRLPDRLPWACLVAPGVVLQKDAIFQRTLAFRGPDLASSLDSELLSASARLNNALRRLGSGWALFVEAQRFLSSAYPAADWSSPAAAVVDRERRSAFEEAGAHYESSYYLTFACKLPPDRAERAAAFFYDGAGNLSPEAGERSALARELYAFQKSVGEIADILRAVFPEVGLLDDAQTLSYLHSTVSTHRHPVRAPETPMYLDALLPDMPFTPGDVPMLGDHFLCTSTISGFPSSTLPGLLDALIRGVLHRLFRSALEDEVIDSNPIAAVRTPKTREVRKQRAILTDDEFAKFVGCADIDLELRMLALVARCEGGMRTGDLNAWDWSMIDRVEFAECFIPRSKTKTPQRLAVPAALAPFLRAWWQRAGEPESGPVFPVTRGARAGQVRSPVGLSFAKRLRRDLCSGPAFIARSPSRFRGRARARARTSAEPRKAPSSLPTPPTRCTSRRRRPCPSTFTPSVARSTRRSPRPGSTCSTRCTSRPTRTPRCTRAT